MWQELVEFNVPNMEQDTAASTTLTLNMFDWDRMGSDDFMGKVQQQFFKFIKE